MNEAGAGFFERLELELREAAERPVRRAPRAGAVGAALAGLVVLAIALVPALVVLGGGDEQAGDAVTGGRTTTERPQVGSIVQRPDGPHVVVAQGRAPVAGPWQMETYERDRIADPDTGEEYQRAGLPCLGLHLSDAGQSHAGISGGQCGDFPRTPGFSRVQHSAPNTLGAGPVREILVYGRTPEETSAVRMTAKGGVRIDARLFAGPDARG